MEKSLNSHDHKILQSLLRQIRIVCNLTQANLAQILSQPQSFISKYESGERRLDLVEIKKICAATGITLIKFIERFDKLADEAKRKIQK
jgi:transcriptional regulator with XRE-family HTH domain